MNLLLKLVHNVSLQNNLYHSIREYEGLPKKKCRTFLDKDIFVYQNNANGMCD